MQVHRDELLKNLEKVRNDHGEEAYNNARMSLAKMLIFSPGGEAFLREAFPDLDLEAVKNTEVADTNRETMQQDLISAIRTHVPNIRTQAQLDLFMSAFNALALTFDLYYAPVPDEESAERARNALNTGLDLAKKLRDMSSQVGEIPPEQRSKDAEAFVAAPKEFTEIEEQRRLLAELDAVKSLAELNAWYNTNRQRMESIVTLVYRNELFDSIREKKGAFAN